MSHLAKKFGHLLERAQYAFLDHLKALVFSYVIVSITMVTSFVPTPHEPKGRDMSIKLDQRKASQ